VNGKRSDKFVERHTAVSIGGGFIARDFFGDQPPIFLIGQY
jgi:hypothetical protein